MRKSILKAIFTISFFAVLTRAASFGFKVILSRTLGAELLGIYQVGVSVFFVLLAVTASGIPLVVSKMTAKHRVQKDIKSEHGVFTGALIINIVCAAAICLFILVLREPLSRRFTSPQSFIVLLLLLPCIAASSVQMAARGNLWGRQLFRDVCLIDFVETTLRIVVCILLFVFFDNHLYSAAASLSIAYFVSAIIGAIVYFKRKGRFASPKGHIKPLIKSSVPITMVRASTTITASLIAIFIPFILTTFQGSTTPEALYFLGATIGMALPILYVPNTVIGAMAFVLVPTLSESSEGGQGAKDRLKVQIEQAVIFSVVISAIFIPALLIMGRSATMFLFGNELAGQFLTFAALLLIPIGIESITSSIMNSLGLEIQGFVNYILGAILMFGYMFLVRHSFNALHLTVALGIMLTFSSILDVLAIKRKTGAGYKFLIPLGITIAILIPSTIFTYFMYNIMALPAFLQLAVTGILSVAFVVTLMIIFGVIKLSVFTNERVKGNKKDRPMPVKLASKKR
ncbi:MAG: oligosaccharide flippase family protein [Firmicutes bacterium]|nr:oligosaccharide flippase family protein [Bacillota bacterium]